MNWNLFALLILAEAPPFVLGATFTGLLCAITARRRERRLIAARQLRRAETVILPAVKGGKR